MAEGFTETLVGELIRVLPFPLAEIDVLFLHFLEVHHLLALEVEIHCCRTTCHRATEGGDRSKEAGVDIGGGFLADYLQPLEERLAIRMGEILGDDGGAEKRKQERR